MTDLTVSGELANGGLQQLGGRALTSTIIAKEVPPTCHPLSAENKLVFAPGMLSGTGAPCSGRLSAGAKSPLTRTIKESNSGGMGAIDLAICGVHAMVLEGETGRWQALPSGGHPRGQSAFSRRTIWPGWATTTRWRGSTSSSATR